MSVSTRVGIVAVGRRVVYRTTRAEETSPLPMGRRGWGRHWLAGGLAVPGISEEGHIRLSVVSEDKWWVLLASFAPLSKIL